VLDWHVHPYDGCGCYLDWGRKCCLAPCSPGSVYPSRSSVLGSCETLSYPSICSCILCKKLSYVSECSGKRWVKLTHAPAFDRSMRVLHAKRDLNPWSCTRPFLPPGSSARPGQHGPRTHAKACHALGSTNTKKCFLCVFDPQYFANDYIKCKSDCGLMFVAIYPTKQDINPLCFVRKSQSCTMAQSYTLGIK
jgi:hypothetical protein